MKITVEMLAAAIEEAGNWNLPHELAERLLPFIERHIAAGQQGAGAEADATFEVDYSKFKIVSIEPKPAGAVPLPETPIYTLAVDGSHIHFTDGSGSTAEQMVESVTRYRPGSKCDVQRLYTEQMLTSYGDAREAAAPHALREKLRSCEEALTAAEAREAAGRAVAVPAMETFAERLADAISLIDLNATHIPVLVQADKELRALYRDMKAKPHPTPQQPAAEGAADPGSMPSFDAGLLGSGGGGDVDWWQDYIRSLLNDAHDHYVQQAGQLTNQAQGAGRDAVCPESIERALKHRAFEEDGAVWPDAYGEEEQRIARKEMRGILAAAARRDGPSAYCRDCQAVGMSNCGHFDKCSGATCITCHRPLNPTPAADAGGVIVTDEVVNRAYQAFHSGRHANTFEAWRAAITAALTQEVSHGE